MPPTLKYAEFQGNLLSPKGMFKMGESLKNRDPVAPLGVTSL